jgi:MoaA/NifB/PqqE/SkfB family radical SAM enzyme
MYSYADIREIHFEITSKCQARCPQCPRRVPGGGILNPFITLEEVSLETFKQWFPDNFLKQLTKFFMCGNLGDPIVAHDTLLIFEHLRKVSPEIKLAMNTNGSARNVDFWNSLAKLQVEVTFGIDGLEDTHQLYRVNTDWNTVIRNAQQFINAGGHAIWHMLVFKHNEHQINECRNLSNNLGFKWFSVKHSTRWNAYKLHAIDDIGKTVHTIEPSQYSIDMYFKEQTLKNSSQPKIACKAKEQRQIYVSANGNVNPCCWLDLQWTNPDDNSRINYIDVITDFPNLNKNMLQDIVDNGHFEQIEQTWNLQPLEECSKQCSIFDKHKEQFVEG